MEPIGDRHEKLIPDESRPPSHYAQLTSDVPGLPGTLKPTEVTGPDIAEATVYGFVDLAAVAADLVAAANTNPFLAEVAESVGMPPVASAATSPPPDEDQVVGENQGEDSGLLAAVYQNDHIERQISPNGGVRLYYVNAGWLWNADPVYIGTLDPVSKLVTIGDHLVPLAKVENEVSSLGTTDDWAEWAKDKAVDPDAPTYFNLTFAHRPDRHNEVALAQQKMEFLAKQAVMHLATAPLAITIAPRGLAHVLSRHTAGGALSAGKSVFNKGESIPALIARARGVAPTRQANGNLQRIVDAGRIIGTDRATGQPTRIYTVITDAHGNFKTAFPGLP